MSANGQLNGDELTTIAHISLVWSAPVDQLTGGVIRAAHVTARAWRAMVADAARAGLELEPIQPAGGYRSRAMQSDARAHPGRWNILPGIVQAPVGQSTHGLGNNIDAVGIASNTALRRWLTAHMRDYGFSYRDARNDPSCLHHDGHTAPASTDAAPIQRTDDDEMLSKEAQEWLQGRIDAAVATISDRDRRESRPARAFFLTDVQAPATPWRTLDLRGTVGYPAPSPTDRNRSDQLESLADNYGYTGDHSAQARRCTSAQFETTRKLLAGTGDALFTAR